MKSEILLLVQSLLRSLSHQIRTPLSVVFNDLSYYKTVYPQDDFDRSLDRATQIKEILKISDSLRVTTITAEPLLLRAVLLEAHKACAAQIRIEFEGDPAALLRGDSCLLRQAFMLLLQLFQKSVEVCNDSRIKVKTSPGQFELSLPLRPGLGQKLNQQGPSTSGLTSLFNQQLGLDLLEPPLIDAIVLAHGWQIMARVEQLKLSIVLQSG